MNGRHNIDVPLCSSYELLIEVILTQTSAILLTRRQFHPNRYDDYFAKRYLLDHCASELPEDKLAEIHAIGERLRKPAGAQALMNMEVDNH